MLLIFGFSLLGGAGSVSAQQWVDDHNSCPQTYNSQTCTGSSLACGYTTSDGTLYCEEPTTVNATLPSNTTTDTAAYNGNALGGGFVVDCLKNASTCTPWECQRDSSCNDINVK